MSKVRVKLALMVSLCVALPVQAGAQGGSGASVPDTTWLQWNPTTKTATFKLIAGVPGRAQSPFNFNGYIDGDLVLTVPENSTVVMNFVNDDGTPHSAQIIDDKKPLPNMALDQPAIQRAYTKAVTEGIGQFGTDIIRFKATPAGSYLIFCGVPGHGLSGMWIRLKVSPSVTTASLSDSTSQ